MKAPRLTQKLLAQKFIDQLKKLEEEYKAVVGNGSSSEMLREMIRARMFQLELFALNCYLGEVSTQFQLWREANPR